MITMKVIYDPGPAKPDSLSDQVAWNASTFVKKPYEIQRQLLIFTKSEYLKQSLVRMKIYQ